MNIEQPQPPEPIEEPELDQLYTVKQVAQMFQVSDYTVREWIKTGLLQGIKINSRWKVARKQLVILAHNKYGSDL